MAGFQVADILGGAPKAAKQEMRVVQLTFDALDASGWNAGYRVDDVELLAQSILVQGLQQPLLVAPEAEGKHRIISGHRRYAAIANLRQSGSSVFDLVPCIVQTESGDADSWDNRLRLVLGNATGRDMSDWDKLQQYKELKALLAEGKKAGTVHGRVRDAVQQTLNMSTGQAARYEVILKHADKWQMEQLERGGCSISSVYSVADGNRRRKELEHQRAVEEKAAQAAAANALKVFDDALIGSELLYGFQFLGAGTVSAKAEARDFLDTFGVDAFKLRIAEYVFRDWPCKCCGSMKGEIPNFRMFVACDSSVVFTADGYQKLVLRLRQAISRICKYVDWEEPLPHIDFAKAGSIQLKNDGHRKLFLDAFREWPKLVSVAELGLTVYEYVLPGDGTRILASLILCKDDRSYRKGEWETVEYRIRKPGELYGTSTDSTSYLLELLHKYKRV